MQESLGDKYEGITVQALLDDITHGAFAQEEDGTFHRGDLMLYVQGKEMRQQIRDVKEIERIERESEEHVFEQIEEYNSHLHTEARGLAHVAPGVAGTGQGFGPISGHASGGLAELNRTKEGQSQGLRLSDRLSGS